MELFWILFGLGYGAYRNVKDTLPIKKTDATITHTSFQTWFVIPVWFSGMCVGYIIANAVQALADYIDDYLHDGWSFSMMFGVIAIIIGIVGVIWGIFGILVAAKWARQIEHRIEVLTGEKVQPKDISAEQGSILTIAYVICVILMIIFFTLALNQTE